MTRKNYRLVTMLLLMGATSRPAFAGEILPMSYGENFGSPINDVGSHVLHGAKPEIIDGKAVATPVPVLFLVPNSASVVVSKIQTNHAANCSVVKNELAMESDASDLARRAFKSTEATSDAIIDYSNQQVQAVKDCLKAKRAHSAEASTICALKDDLADAIKDLQGLNQPIYDRILAIQDGMTTRLNNMSSDIGGYAGAFVKLFDPNELTKVRSANPGYEVRLVAMTGISFAFAPAEEGYHGFKGAGRVTTLGYYLQGEPMGAATPEGSPLAAAKVSTGDTTTIGILLSRIGACEPEFDRVGTFSFTYDGYGMLEGDVVYNKWGFYEKISQSATKNGFFTTSTSHKVEENSKDTEDFKVAVVGKAPDGSERDKVEVAAMEERLSDRLEKKLLRMMAEKADAMDVSVPMPNSAGPNGATVAGDAALKCPHVYCQVAGYALKTASAIFGRETSAAQMKQQWNYKVSETWTQTTVTPYPGSSSGLVKFHSTTTG